MTAECRLYIITPPTIDDLAGFGRLLAHALDAGDVAALQIRLKDQPDEVVAAAVDVLLPIARARGVAVILNDRPDLAAATGCELEAAAQLLLEGQSCVGEKEPNLTRCASWTAVQPPQGLPGTEVAAARLCLCAGSQAPPFLSGRAAGFANAWR